MLEQQKFLVSTDVGGVFGFTRHSKEIWKPAILHPNFGGFEAVGWKWLDLINHFARKHDVKIAGIHGKMDGLTIPDSIETAKESIILAGLNSFLIPTPKLIQKYGSKVDYLLLHAPEARKKENMKAIVKNKNNINKINIENHIRPGSWLKSVEIARELRSFNVNAGVVFDLFHFMKSYDDSGLYKDMGQKWDRILSNLDVVLDIKDDKKKPIPISLHIPLGTRMSDSLDFESITENMWRGLSKRIKSRRDMTVIIESQQAGWSVLMTREKGRQKQRDRNTKILDVLDRTEVI